MRTEDLQTLPDDLAAPVDDGAAAHLPGAASGSTIAAYSVGQQIAIAALSAAIGFAALLFIFRLRSFKEVLRRGREDRRAAEAATAP